MDTDSILFTQIKQRKIHKKTSSSDTSIISGKLEKSSLGQVQRKSSRILSLRRGSVPDSIVMASEEDRIKLASSALASSFDTKHSSHVYEVQRSELLKNERKTAWDAAARLSASTSELLAGAIILKIREHERIDPTLFGNVPGEAVPGPETRDMGGRFLVCKPRISRSRIFKICEAMPKGAHLHLHFNSELPPERLLPYARKPEMHDTMFIRSTIPLVSEQDFTNAEVVFSVLPKETKQGNLFEASYNPNWKDNDNASWMRWVDFQAQFPPHVKTEQSVGDLEYHGEGKLTTAAECYVRDKMAITVELAYHDRQTTNGAWACFNQGTRAFKGLLNYEGVYRWYIGHMIDSMIRDKVMYAELRPMLMDKSIPSNDGKTQLDHKAQMKIICEEVEKKQQELKAQDKLNLFPFGLKIIYCTPRSIPRARMQVELQDCLKLKLQYPDLICGFDLVGAEDRPNHIGFYADLLVAFAETCKQLNVSIPFMFHAGETLIDTGGSHNPDNSNLYDSLLLNAKRIGHGYSLLKHPMLVEKYKKQNICLELCPISNELLHLCTNARQHIFPELLAAGLHCTLNADNPSLFRYVNMVLFAT
jgi:adenosine deaminase CECR1